MTLAIAPPRPAHRIAALARNHSDGRQLFHEVQDGLPPPYWRLVIPLGANLWTFRHLLQYLRTTTDTERQPSICQILGSIPASIGVSRVNRKHPV